MAKVAKQALIVDEKIEKNPNRLARNLVRPIHIKDKFLDIVQNQAVESLQSNLYDGKTEYNAIILRTSEVGAMSMVTTDNPIVVRARIPELHSHLPLPRTVNDESIIDMYPEYIAENADPDKKGTMKGGLIRVTHLDTHQTSLRYENGRILEVLNRSVPFAAGFSTLDWTCKGDLAEGSVINGSGEPSTGDNLKKHAAARGNNKGSDTRELPALVGLGLTPSQKQDARLATRRTKATSVCAPTQLLQEFEQRGDMRAYRSGKPIGTVELDFIKGSVSKHPQVLAFGPLGNMHPIVTKTVDGVPFAKYFVKMKKDAERVNVTLLVTSAFRTMRGQQTLFAQKGGDLLRRSSPASKRARKKVAWPGTSNHQNGIAIDIGTGGGSNAAYKWLSKNAVKYGFIRTVRGETWHWEYRPKTAEFGALGMFDKVPATHMQGMPGVNALNGGWPLLQGAELLKWIATKYEGLEKK